MYDREINIIKEFFSRKFLHAVPGWIEGCAEFFVSNNRNYSPNQLQEFAFEQWKLADLREMGSGCLPPDLNTTLKTILQGKYAIQIEWIRDIGHASYAQLRKIRQNNNPNEDIGSTKPQSWEPRQSRMMQIRISDGLQSIHAIEYKRVPAFDESFCPGMKALISGPLECRRGMLLLEEHNIQIIGGEVDSLIISNAPENILARVLGLPLNPNPNINFNPGNEGETQNEENESRTSQQTPSSDAARTLQQSSLPSSSRNVHQAPSSSTAGPLQQGPSSSTARPLQQGSLLSSSRNVQQGPSSSTAGPLQQGSLLSSSRNVQQGPSSSTAGPLQQGSLLSSSRNVQQGPSSSTGRPLQQSCLPSSSRNVQQVPLSNVAKQQGSVPNTTRTQQQVLPANTTHNTWQMLPSNRTIGQVPLSNTSRTTQQTPQTSTARTVPEPNLSLSRSVTNGAQDFSRTAVDNSDDLLNDEEILGEDMLAHLSALENEYLSEKEPPEITGAFHDEDIVEEPNNFDDNILLSIPDMHIAEESFKSSSSSASVGDKNRKKVSFGSVQKKPQAMSQKKITSYINQSPVKQQPSTSSGINNQMPHTSVSKLEDFMSDSGLESEFTADDQAFSSEMFDKTSKPSKVQAPVSSNSSSKLSSDCTGIVTSSSPFVYLKQIKSNTAVPKTYRAKVFILTLISELELKDDEWVLYAKLSDGTANLDVQLSSGVMEKLLNLPKETLIKWKPHIKTNKDLREELKMRMKTAEHRLIHFNNLVDIKVEPGKQIPCVTAVHEVSSEDMQALKLRLEYIREKCVPKA